MTTRDGAGDIASIYTYLPRYLESSRAQNVLAGLWIIDRRASLLKAEKLIEGDRYLFIRDVYLQRREFLTNDGELGNDPFLEGSE